MSEKVWQAQHITLDKSDTDSVKANVHRAITLGLKHALEIRSDGLVSFVFFSEWFMHAVTPDAGHELIGLGGRSLSWLQVGCSLK